MSRKPYATTIEEKLIKKLKVMAIEEGRRANDLLEELLEKYFKERENKIKE